MPRRILIADDSSFLREQLRNFLEQTSSWQVFEAANGLEAVQKTQRVHPDVIILDYCMPGDGWSGRGPRAQEGDSEYPGSIVLDGRILMVTR